MKCANCGSEVSDDNKFCPNCGDKMVSSGNESQSSPIELSKPADTTVNLDSSETESLLQGGESTVTPAQPEVNNMSQGNPGFASNPQTGGQTQSTMNTTGTNEQDVKKKSKAPLFIGLGIVLVALVAIIGVAIFAGQNFFKRTFSSATDYYKYVEKKNVNNNNNWKAYDSYVKRLSTINSSKYTQNLSIELSDDAKDLIETFSGGTDFSWFEKLDMNMEFAAKDNNYEASVSSKINDKDLVSFKAYADDENFYLTIPDLTDEYIKVSKEYLTDNGFDFDAYMSSYESLPSKDKLKSLTKNYLNVYLKNISKVKKEKVKLEASGVTQSAYKLSYTLEDDKIKEMFKALAEEASNDKELKEVIRNFAEVSMGANSAGLGTTVDDIMDDYDSLLKEMTDSIDDADFDGLTFTMSVYVDNSGNIIGRDINFSNDESEIVVNYAFTKKGKDVGILYAYDYDGSSVKFSGKGKLSGANLSGEFSLVQDDDGDETTLLVVDVEKLNLAKFGTENQEMALTVKAEDGLGDAYYGMDMFSGYALRLEADKSKSVVAILDGEDPLVTITGTEKKEAAKKISLPKKMDPYDIEDADGASDWVATFDTEKFIEQLKDTDLPSDWVDSIESSLEFMID